MKLNELLDVIEYDTDIKIVYYYEPQTFRNVISYHGSIQELDREEIINILDRKVNSITTITNNEIKIVIVKEIK